MPFPLSEVVAFPRNMLLVYLLLNALLIACGWTLRQMCSVFTTPGVAAAAVLGFVVLSRAICRWLVFPGSTAYVSRQIERDAARRVVARMRYSVEGARHFVQLLMLGGRPLQFKTAFVETFDARDGFMDLVQGALQAVQDAGGLCQYGQQVLHSMVTVNECLDTLRAASKHLMHVDASVFTRAHATSLQSSVPRGASGAAGGGTVWDCCSATDKALTTLSSQLPWLLRVPTPTGAAAAPDASASVFARLAAVASGVASVVRDTFLGGSTKPGAVAGMTFMRNMLLLSRRAHHVWLTGASGHKLDAVLVPANATAAPKVSDGAGAGSDVQLSRNSAGQVLPTVVLCGPNAALYELSGGCAELMDFYSHLGFNVLAYNYRGYGRSQGTPSPGALQADAEAIVKHLRANYGVEVVGAHAESIGGLVACHLAAKGLVNFVVADRTFDTLPSVARQMMGVWAERGLRAVTCWTGSNAASILKARCPKVLAVDPNDTIIHWLSCLAVGTSQAFLRDRLSGHRWAELCSAARLVNAHLRRLCLRHWYMFAPQLDLDAGLSVDDASAALGDTADGLASAVLGHLVEVLNDTAALGALPVTEDGVQCRLGETEYERQLLECIVGGRQLPVGTVLPYPDASSRTGYDPLDDSTELLPPSRSSAQALVAAASLRNSAGQTLAAAALMGTDGVLGCLSSLLVWGSSGEEEWRPAYVELDQVVANMKSSGRSVDGDVLPLVASLQEFREVAGSPVCTGKAAPRTAFDREAAVKEASAKALSGIGLATAPDVSAPRPQDLQGAIIPLTCGHNGMWSGASRRQLLYHLVDLGLVAPDMATTGDATHDMA